MNTQSNPRYDDTEIVTVRGIRGILANKREIDNFQGPIPLSEYPINEDPNPRVVRKPWDDPVVRSRQDVTVRFLEPPPPPAGGEIVIIQEKPIIPPKAPPVVIRQVPQQQTKPKEPLVIREIPPKLPPPQPRKIIKILPPKVPPPPRKLIVEKLPPIEDQAQPIIIERWLAPKPQPRRVVFEGAVNAAMLKQEPVFNEIIEYEPPKVVVNKEIKNTGVTRVDPDEYFAKYRDSLVDSRNLPDFVREIRPPPGFVLASEAKDLPPPPLEGDLQALSQVDLEREGLAEYRIYLQKNNQQSTSSSGHLATTSSTSGTGTSSGNSIVGAIVNSTSGGGNTNYYSSNQGNYSNPSGSYSSPGGYSGSNGSSRIGWADTPRLSPSYEIRATTTTTSSSPTGPDGNGYFERRTTIYKAENSSSF